MSVEVVTSRFPVLRLARVMAPVSSLGPGRRAVVWLQGCALGCPGCVSPDLWDAGGGRDMAVDALVDLLASVAADCEGLTVSGGEPFEQYEALLALAVFSRRVLGWPTLVFTGYTLAELRRRHPDRAFEHVLDSLIDGRFEVTRPANDGWRGSTNQKFWRFVDGQAIAELEGFVAGAWSVAVGADATILAGVPRRGDLSNLATHLTSAGVNWRWSERGAR
jgi:anaerobic ribonucleoside-triphosphate reductase activating protein